MRSIGFVLVAAGLGFGATDLRYWWGHGEWALTSIWDALELLRGAGMPIAFERADFSALIGGGLELSAAAVFAVAGLIALCLADDV